RHRKSRIDGRATLPDGAGAAGPWNRAHLSSGRDHGILSWRNESETRGGDPGVPGAGDAGGMVQGIEAVPKGSIDELYGSGGGSAEEGVPSSTIPGGGGIGWFDGQGNTARLANTGVFPAHSADRFYFRGILGRAWISGCYLPVTAILCCADAVDS